MLFRTLCGGHWRFCVVTAFLIVVYICRRGLVPGLGPPTYSSFRLLTADGGHRPLAWDFTQTDGGHRPLSTWDSRVSHRRGLRCFIIALGLLVLGAACRWFCPGVLGERHVHTRRRLKAS